MIMKGQKRKVPPEDVEAPDRSSSLWESQRQFVLTLSLSKYQRSQELPEPSLRRSVLIANTLRQVSLESRGGSVESEASQPLCSSQSEPQENSPSTADGHQSPATFPAGCSPDSSNCAATTSTESCHSTASNAALSEKDEDEDEDWSLMSMDPDFALSAAISSVLTALDSTIDGSQPAAPRTPLRSLENLPGPSEGGVAWVKPGVRGHEGSMEQQQQQQQESRVWESSIEVMRSSYLSDLTVEDLFQDIDTSLLERDIGVVGVRGGGAGYVPGDDLLRYLPPLSASPSPPSIAFNQNQKCLPSFSSFCPTSPSSSSSSPPFSNQNHMREGLDLDHLMEILVES